MGERLLGEQGAVSSEYALVAVLIAVAIVVAVGALGEAVFDLYDSDELLGALGAEAEGS